MTEKKLQALKNLKTIYENMIALYSQQDICKIL